jgi:hypothetical protein
MTRPPSPVGCHGRLTRHGGIAPGRLGEVMVAVGGGVQAYLARDADDGTIAPLTEVAVVEQLAPRTVLVTPLYATPQELE